jgi:hypothetical protein
VVELPEYLKTDKVYNEYAGSIKSTLKDEEKNTRDGKLHERLELRVRKLNNIRMEQARILRKVRWEARLTAARRGREPAKTELAENARHWRKILVLTRQLAPFFANVSRQCGEHASRRLPIMPSKKTAVQLI